MAVGLCVGVLMVNGAGPASETPSASFGVAVRWVIDVAEGGSRLITDQGGRTRYGISQRAYPGEDIEHLTRERAVGLYLRDYWAPVQGDALPGALALVVFDAAVNQGVQRAVRLLQLCLGVEADGIVGPETLGAARREPGPELVARYLVARLQEYAGLARAWPEIHGASLHGWNMRLFRLALEAGKWRNA
jgi:lysozyme family protein